MGYLLSNLCLLSQTSWEALIRENTWVQRPAFSILVIPFVNRTLLHRLRIAKFKKPIGFHILLIQTLVKDELFSVWKVFMGKLQGLSDSRKQGNRNWLAGNVLSLLWPLVT